jgi:hypothetical protein
VRESDVVGIAMLSVPLTLRPETPPPQLPHPGWGILFSRVS